MARSSSIHERWSPRKWPTDETAASALREWMAGTDGVVVGSDLDFSGADLSGADFRSYWFNGSAFRGVVLRDVALAHAHLERADFTGADLSGADLIDAIGDRTVLRDARLGGAILRGCEFFDSDLSGADLTGATLGDGSFFRSNFTGANLTDATADKLSLPDCVLDSVEVTGFSGTVIGPISVVLRGERTLLDGADLEEWFGARGARVTRFKPAR